MIWRAAISRKIIYFLKWLYIIVTIILSATPQRQNLSHNIPAIRLNENVSLMQIPTPTLLATASTQRERGIWTFDNNASLFFVLCRLTFCVFALGSHTLSAYAGFWLLFRGSHPIEQTFNLYTFTCNWNTYNVRPPPIHTETKSFVLTFCMAP